MSSIFNINCDPKINTALKCMFHWCLSPLYFARNVLPCIGTRIWQAGFPAGHCRLWVRVCFHRGPGCQLFLHAVSHCLTVWIEGRKENGMCAGLSCLPRDSTRGRALSQMCILAVGLGLKGGGAAQGSLSSRLRAMTSWWSSLWKGHNPCSADGRQKSV